MDLKLSYDPAADAASIRLATGAVLESEEVAAGVVLDYDAEGRVMGIEFIGARNLLPADALESACLISPTPAT